MITTRRVLILILLVGATFLIAHTINAVVAEALFMPAGASFSRPGVDMNSQSVRAPASLAEHIRTSGLFPIPPDPLGAVQGDGVGPVISRQSLNAASRIKLMGVVVGNRRGVSAIIEDLASKRQDFYRLHDHIPDIGQIHEIRSDGILIRQGALEEFLELSTGQPDKVAMPQVASTGRAGAVTSGTIRKVLDRREVDQAMNNLPKLLSQARAVPVLANGAITGFRLDYIAPASFYEKIGLQYGDTLKQVNGVEIKDPSTMLSLFQQLRNERSVKLDVLRNNQPTTMMFDIR